VAYVRTVKTASGAIAVQIVWSSRRGLRSIEHLGSAHNEAELAALKAAAAERLAAGQAVLDLGVAGPPGSEPLPITSSQMTHLWDGLCAAYRVLGFESATKGDNVFRDLVLARIIESTSKPDTERVLSEVGVAAASYATVKLRLPSYAAPSWRQSLVAAAARHARLGPASPVLFDVSTLYFETDAGDGFREPGFSKERRLEPQITLGLLTDASGFPPTVEAVEFCRQTVREVDDGVRVDFVATDRVLTVGVSERVIQVGDQPDQNKHDQRNDAANEILRDVDLHVGEDQQP